MVLPEPARGPAGVVTSDALAAGCHVSPGQDARAGQIIRAGRSTFGLAATSDCRRVTVRYLGSGNGERAAAAVPTRPAAG